MAIIKRLVKGSALTHAELDGNFTDLDWRVTAALLKAERVQPDCGGSAMLPGPVVDGDYTLVLKAPHAGIITETTAKCLAGTCTVTPKINSTAIGGAAHSVSTSEASISRTAPNEFAAGDDIVITVSSGVLLQGLMFSFKYTRTFA